jgi:hypothetical protein
MAQFDRTYYGSKTDIELAKQSGLKGNFYDVSAYGDNSKYQDLLHAYQTGANPVILGGAGAVGGINDNLYKQLVGAGANIQRIGGADRYQVQDNFRNYATNLQNQQNMFNSDQLRQNLVNTAKDQTNTLFDQQKQSQLAGLKAEKDKAIGGINQQKAALAPQFQAQRNQADVVNQQNVQRLREDIAIRFYYAPDLQPLPMNAYRFINAVSDFATHAKPLRETSNYRESLFERTIIGHPLIDKSYQLVKQIA